MAKNKELLFSPLQRRQEFGFVGRDRIQMSCRGSENPMPSVYLAMCDRPKIAHCELFSTRRALALVGWFKNG